MVGRLLGQAQQGNLVSKSALGAIVGIQLFTLSQHFVDFRFADHYPGLDRFLGDQLEFQVKSDGT